MSPFSPARAPHVSVVAPCHNEGAGLREFHRRAAAAAFEVVGDEYEIVLVDDGSRDDTWDVIASMALEDFHVRGVRLMRNYGHQPAATAGLSVARGDCVMLIDADLQDPPELLGAMMDLIDRGADVVYGQRIARQGETWLKRSTAAVFYKVLHRMAATPIPRDTGDFRLMRRSIVDALAAMPERQRFIRGMVSWIGGRQVALRYERHSRFAGRTSYPWGKVVRLALDGITSFSTVPLRIASYLGLGAAMVSLLLLAYSLVGWAMGHTIAGWTSVIAAVTLVGAVQLLVLGVLGEYIGQVFQEVKGRPIYIVDRVIADCTEHVLPAEFTSLSPSGRREVVDALSQGEPRRHAAGESRISGVPSRTTIGR